MKYTLVINQKALIDNFPKIDILGACLYDVIKNCCSIENSKFKKIIDNNEEYTWLDYSMLKNQLPIFDLKSKNAVISKIKILKEYGILKTKIVQNSNGHKNVYVRLTEEALRIENYDPGILGDQGGLMKSNKNEALVSGNTSPGTEECSIININNKKKYIDEIDNEKAVLVVNKLIEEYEENIGNVRFKKTVASRLDDLLREFSAVDLKDIIRSKGKDKWFMDNNASRGPTWFFENKKRLRRYIEEC